MPTLQIACLQTSGTADAPQNNLAELDASAQHARQLGASLLITPELFLTGYDIGDSMLHWADQPLLDQAQLIAARHRIPLVVGLPRRIAGRVYNCAAVIDRQGQTSTTYAKSHLFGELDRQYFTAGDSPYALVHIDSVRVAIMICYDAEFPEAVRSAALAGAHLVAVPTAQMEPFAAVATTIIPARAWENQLYLAYANHVGTERDTVYVGRSSIVGPDGLPLASAALETRLLTATVETETVATAQRDNPYLTDRRPDIYAASEVSQDG